MSVQFTTVYVINKLRSSVVVGYTRGSYDIDAQASIAYLPRVYPSTTLLCSLSGLYYHSHIQTHALVVIRDH